MKDESWDLILAKIIQEFSVNVGMIHYLNPNDNHLYIVAYSNDFPAHLIPLISKIPNGKGIAGETAASAAPVVSCNLAGNDAPACARPLAKTLGISGMLSVPIFHGQNVVGTIGIGSFTERVFTPDEIEHLIKKGKAISDQLISMQQSVKQG